MSDDSRPHFLIIVPVFQAVHPRAFANFMAMELHVSQSEHDKYRFSIAVPERKLLHSAMNEYTQVAIDAGCVGMIIADDDCFPPVDAISRLLRRYEAGAQVVAALGYMRGFPYTTTIGRYFPEGITIAPDPLYGHLRFAGFEWIDDVSKEPEDLIAADFCGFPLALISTAALLKMARPWFGTSIDGGECTHDVFFGQRAKDAGVQIYVDRTVTCGHLLDPEIIHDSNRAVARAVRHAVDEAQRNAEAPKKPRDGKPACNADCMEVWADGPLGAACAHGRTLAEAGVGL